jgi:hypothetical protein
MLLVLDVTRTSLRFKTRFSIIILMSSFLTGGSNTISIAVGSKVETSLLIETV